MCFMRPVFCITLNIITKAEVDGRVRFHVLIYFYAGFRVLSVIFESLQGTLKAIRKRGISCF